MGKDLKELAGDVIQAVFDLSNYLEETDLMMGVPEQQDPIRKLVSEALIDYPQSQIELVLECLVAEAHMDTSEEAEAHMDTSEEEDEEDEEDHKVYVKE